MAVAAASPLAGRARPRCLAALASIAAVPWPLFAVLAVQASLSLRLVWSNTAFLDEATYIWAGRIELWHVLNGTSVPAYATYFSGAPVIYPPLAGLADMAGGLAAARLLSLAFMLGTTCLLWGATRRLFGWRAAACAVALFASVGPTQFLGSLATYDAMALFLLTLSAWLVIVAKDRDDSTLILIAAVLALVTANAAKYATGLFDLVVAALAVLTYRKRGLKGGLGRGGLIIGSVIALAGALLAIGGPWYVAGIEFTTLARAAGDQSPGLVLADSARWIGPVVAAAAVGVAVAWYCDRRQAAIAAVLAAAGVLAPLNQARIHTTISLSKHVDFGAWFACIIAGYAIARLARIMRRRWLYMPVTLAAAAVILVPGGSAGRAQAYSFSQAWPDSALMTSELPAIVKDHPGIYLAEDYVVPAYYLEGRVRWQDWAGTWYFRYKASYSSACIGGSSASAIGAPASSSQAAKAYTEAVGQRYFALIIVDFGDTAAVDEAIAAAIHRYGTYHVIAELPYSDARGVGQYTVWAPTPGKDAYHGHAC